jgi:cyclopropane fatty-acyl-phospholipid synthase-like methyltransferase
MEKFNYKKSLKYTDLDTVYAQCSGPGGLQLAEFMAEKMGVSEGKKFLDIGTNRGWQTCFFAKEYGVFVVGIDPWDDREQGNPMIDHLRINAEKWQVADSVVGLKIGVPETCFADESFDYVYSTTALEMVRVSQGVEGYLTCLKEIYRVLKPGGTFGLGEPMHLDVEIPEDLLPYVSQEEYAWKDCFRTIHETAEIVQAAGFEIVESAYAPDAWQWWMDFAKYDPFCKKEPEDDPKILAVDGGRWTSFGYVIGKKAGR